MKIAFYIEDGLEQIVLTPESSQEKAILAKLQHHDRAQEESRMTEGPFHYRVRLTKGAPFSAVKVWRGFPIDNVTGEMLFERPHIWRAIRNGEHVPIEDVMVEIDGITKRPVIKGEEIDEATYLFIMRTNVWAARHDPDSPEAKPHEKVNLNAIRPIFCKTVRGTQ